MFVRKSKYDEVEEKFEAALVVLEKLLNLIRNNAPWLLKKGSAHERTRGLRNAGWCIKLGKNLCTFTVYASKAAAEYDSRKMKNAKVVRVVVVPVEDGE